MRHRRTRCLQTGLLLLLLIPVCSKTPGLGRAQLGDPPEEYETILASELVAEEEVARLAARAEDVFPATADGVVLLDEQVFFVRRDGSSVVASHRVLLPRTARGAERTREIVEPFLSHSQRVSIARAHRIASDGRVVALRDAAAFIKTPSAVAEGDQFTEMAELIMLFPRASAGDLVDFIIVREVDAAIPGEFTEFLTLADLWPVLSYRRSIVAPEDMVDRLRAVPVGLAIETQGPGVFAGELQVLRWRLDGAPGLRLERGRAPIRQAGPGVWVSTLERWRDLAAWYSDMTSDATTLTSELARRVKEWTANLHSPDQAVRRLHRVVAEQVQYLAIQFGKARIEPRSAEEVWSSGYGDCKDQVQLLRALLAEVGIEAHPALVNTCHVGRIETSVPDYRQFDHVILAVELGGGAYLFCDPTDPQSEPGQLPPCCQGRKALVLAGDRAEFVDIPAAPVEELSLRFDLETDAYGGIRGWLHLKAQGHQGRLLTQQLARATSQADEYAALASFLGQFYADVEVFDAARRRAAGGILLDVYFTGRVETEWRGIVLRVPAPALLFPAVGGAGRRETAFYHPRARVIVEATYTLPPGWRPRTDAPRRVSASGIASSVEARWSVDHRQAVGSFEYETTDCLIHPAEFQGYRSPFEELDAWLKEPLRLGQDEAAANARPSSEDKPANLARLPSGEGQMRLVDAVCPRDGDLDQRRMALSRVCEWFEEEPSTALQAGLEIVVIDQVQGRQAQAFDEIQVLLSRYGDRVERRLTAWAEFLAADSLQALGKKREAVEIYERLAREEGLSAHRRGWAYFEAARLWAPERLLDAIDLLDEAVREDSSALPDQVALLTRLLLRGSADSAAVGRLDRIASSHPQRALDIYERMLSESAALLNHERDDEAASLCRVLHTHVETTADAQTFVPRLEEFESEIRQTAACRDIAREMRQHFASHQPAWWGEAAIPVAAIHRQHLVAYLQDLDREGDVHRFVRGTVELTSRWTVAPDFFGFLIWRCAQRLEEIEAESELVSKFRGWCDALPEANRFSQ